MSHNGPAPATAEEKLGTEKPIRCSDQETAGLESTSASAAPVFASTQDMQNMFKYGMAVPLLWIYLELQSRFQLLFLVKEPDFFFAMFLNKRQQINFWNVQICQEATAQLMGDLPRAVWKGIPTGSWHKN